MLEPTIAEERLAKLLALHHGGTMVYRTREGKNMTVAGMRGYDSGWSWEHDRYVERHWKEYVPAARAVLESRNAE